jgi:hypothetical protein
MYHMLKDIIAGYFGGFLWFYQIFCMIYHERVICIVSALAPEPEQSLDNGNRMRVFNIYFHRANIIITLLACI